jgi:aspartokinase/homoserine dehydrogenase 1
MFEKTISSCSDNVKDMVAIREQHLQLAKAMLPKYEYTPFLEDLNEDMSKLEELLSSVSVMKDNLYTLRDHIISMGEQFSSKLIVRMFKGAVRVDGRDIIVTKRSGGAAQILWDETCEKIKDRFGKFQELAVVPGYCGKTPDGYVTTLGKEGSDVTASMLGAALEAKSIDIYTDYDGMMTADPQLVPEARAIKSLSYSEAAEMCHFGSKALFTPAIWPAIKCSIPIRILNTFNEEAKGTLINDTVTVYKNRPVKGISNTGKVSLVTVFGNGLMGQVGISYKIFGALAEKGINIIFIAQASSEYSISFAVEAEEGARAMSIIKDFLGTEEEDGTYIDVIMEPDMSVIAVVGEKMKQTPGISGHVFGALGRNKINVVATAQGGSEYNVSAVIKEKDVAKAIKALHDEFFGTPTEEIDLYIAGTGSVGHSLLLDVKAQRNRIMKSFGIKFHLKGLADKNIRMISDKDFLGSYPQKWKRQTSLAGMEDFVNAAIASSSPKKIFVDCTDSEEIVGFYEKLLGNRINVVSANKLASSGPLNTYYRLTREARENRVEFLNETGAGAPWPVLSAIENMVITGDRIERIYALVSDSLTIILNEIEKGSTLGKAVKYVIDSGITEPDPLIDLSGIDMKRKMLTLARKSGYRFEGSSIEQEPFIPNDILKKYKDETFYRELDSISGKYEKMVRSASSKGCKLRYIASLEGSKCKIGFREISSSEELYHIDKSEYAIVLYSKSNGDFPLVIKGYGADGKVTAKGVFSDIIKVAMR